MKAEPSPTPLSTAVVAMHPYYIARAIGGLLFLIGAVVGCYNIWMTDTHGRSAGRPNVLPIVPSPRSQAFLHLNRRSERAMFNLHYQIERKTIGLVLAIIGVASIGGAVEIIPLFTIHQTVEDAPEDAGLHTARDRGPQHLHPRRLLCLPFADDPDAARRGRAIRSLFARRRIQIRSSDALGSKRTGPDLARMGNKYSDEWHVRHLNNPRDVVPESVMPHYAWLGRTELRTGRSRPASGCAAEGRRALHR